MNASERAREQGVALLMTLGVLSLILILAMSFSFTARSDRQLSRNNADLTRSRLLARSGLNRVIAALAFQCENQMTGTDKIYPATAGTGSIFTNGNLTTDHPLYGYRAFWVSTSTTPEMAQLESALSLQYGMGTTATPTAPVEREGFIPRAQKFSSLPAAAGLGSASWHHVFGLEPWIDTNGNGAVDAGEYTDINNDGSWGECLIGRTSFLGFDESGKLDPGALVTVNTEPVWDRTNYSTCYYDLNASDAIDTVGTGTTDPFREYSGSIPRRGLSPQEIILPAMPFSPYTPINPEYFWDDIPLIGSTSNKSTWFDWRHIANDSNFGAKAWTVATSKDFLHVYFPYSYDIEAYRYSGDDYQRLNLWDDNTTLGAGVFDWNGKTWDATTLGNLYAPAGMEKFWTSSDVLNNTPPTAAPALGGFRDESGGDISLQVLANLVDFCDKEAGADAEQATYIDLDGDSLYSDGDIYGLDKTPYINELAFEAMYTYDDNATPSDTTDDTGSISLTVYVELVNMFEVTRNIGGCETGFSLQYRGTSDPTFTTVPLTLTVTGPAASIGAHAYATLQGTTTVAAYASDAPKTIVIQVSDCKITLTNTSAQLVDFAHPVSSTPLGISNALSGQSASAIGYGSMETNDPRCNTKESDWPGVYANGSNSDITLDLTGSGGGNTNKAASTTSVPSPTDAGAGDPTNVSSGYIANTPRITFWELGAVHRGEPWRTINLTAFSDLPDRKYSDGDAILLDQLKLGDFTHVRGRVNVNSPDPVVWANVLNQIKVGWAYTDTHDSSTIATAGTALTNPTAIAQAITTSGATPTRGGAQFSSPGAIANVVELTNGTGGVAQGTDSEKEEIIGKIANLLTARQNLFTVLVTAQTVTDTGKNNPGTSRSVLYDSTNGYYCTIQSEQKLLATVYRDAFANTFRIVRLEYVEE